MLHAPPGEEERVVQDHMQDNVLDDGCVAVADWQSKSFPNCNSFHELDLHRAVDESESSIGASIGLLGTGWFRSAWKWNVERDTSIALKTLRFDREFSEEFFELHRRDAVAMERLTASPFVMNIYGYCGQSALNELADFQFDTLEKYDRFLRGKRSAEESLMKLQLASSVAVGVAHIHEIDERPSMVHYDLNPSNIAIVAGGKPKMNDFNTAEFLRYNPKTNQTCGFKSRLHDPWWRAPEEVTIGNTNLLDEKVDVYALGNLLYHILTTLSPRGKTTMSTQHMEHARVVVAQGQQPRLRVEFKDTKEPALMAIREAMGMCFEPDPTKRPSSRSVTTVLMHALAKANPVVQE
jgi:serine/threonine protein kinase